MKSKISEEKVDNILVSIVIVTYNSKNYLINCLISILSSQTKSNYEILVIDNASKDDTFVNIPPLFPSVIFIKNEANNGFSYANNQGIKLAHGDYILLLNPDTLIIDNTIDLMIDFLEKTPTAGACSCMVFNADGSLQPSYFGFPTLLKEFGHLLRIDRSLWLYEKLKDLRIFLQLFSSSLAVMQNKEAAFEVDYLLGACLMLRKTAIDKVGMLDDKIFMYIEDTEICYRMKQNGYGVYYVPKGQIIHYGGKSSGTADQRMLYEYNRSRLYFYKKCYGKIKTIILKSIIVADMLVNMFIIFFTNPRKEMAQLQTRYKNEVDSNYQLSFRDKLREKYKSFRLYASIIAMACKS